MMFVMMMTQFNQEVSMDKYALDAIFWAEMNEIEARKRAGLAPPEVLAQQVLAAVDQYRRHIASDDGVPCCAAPTVDN